MSMKIYRGDSYSFEVARPDGIVLDGYACEYSVVDVDGNLTGLFGTIITKNLAGTAFTHTIKPSDSQILAAGSYKLCTRLSYNDSYSIESSEVLAVKASCFLGSLIVQSFGIEFTSEFT